MISSVLKENCFVSASFLTLQQNIDFYIEQCIQPEIGLEGTVLYDFSPADFSRVADQLSRAGLKCTLHSPFYELYVGSLDPHIRAVSRKKLKKAFELIEIFRPESIVCHLGFEENKHGYREDLWFEHSLEGWRELVGFAESQQTPVMLENTYEKTPVQLKRMLTALDSDYARFCFDVGHVLSFAGNSWQDWLPELAPWLGQLHLHDNHGEVDEHLAPGEGLVDFQGIFVFLQEQHLQPVVTMEPHHPGGMEAGFNYLEQQRFPYWLFS
jgi:sugar phosphate isomerase/epimerase